VAGCSAPADNIRKTARVDDTQLQDSGDAVQFVIRIDLATLAARPLRFCRARSQRMSCLTPQFSITHVDGAFANGSDSCPDELLDNDEERHQ
jgi:hypothetical protein